MNLSLEFIASNSPAWHIQRQALIHQDYQKVNYCKQQHFVISKVEFNPEINSLGIGRLQNQKQRSKLFEYEKQVYHEFERVPDKVLESDEQILPAYYQSDFDIHHLVINVPRGIDPCQTYDHQFYLKEKYEVIDRHYKKQNRINEIRAGSETEGIFRDPKSEFTVPRP